MRFGKGSVAMPVSRWPGWGAAKLRLVFALPVRDRLGCEGRFGRPSGKPFPVFGLLAPNRALCWIENPRVDGSIPSLATTFNFLNFMRFLASPADYRGRFCPEIG